MHKKDKLFSILNPMELRYMGDIFMSWPDKILNVLPDRKLNDDFGKLQVVVDDRKRRFFLTIQAARFENLIMKRSFRPLLKRELWIKGHHHLLHMLLYFEKYTLCTRMV